MASPSALALQTLYRLDASSPDFEDQLYHVLNGVEYTQCVPNLGEGDLTWLVNYLDETFSSLEPAGPASRECLRELRNRCAASSRLPMSCTLSPDALDMDSFPIAAGGFGDVYRGMLNGSSSVCIKRLRTTQGGRERIVGSLCRDAVTWKCLRHPNVVPFLGCIVASFQIISAWMPGGTLMEHIRDKPEVDFVELLSQVANGLCYLHSFDLVHRNLKGPNILVDDSGHARITDFGDAAVINDQDSSNSVPSAVLPSIRWSAPEVMERNAWNKKSDIYSFAMVMIEVFTGKDPFHGNRTSEAVMLIIRGLRPERPTHPALTVNLWELIQRCWSGDPHRRPSASEVLRILLTPAEPQAWKRLISDTLSTGERVNLISSIFSDRKEVAAVGLLSGNNAQTFVDVMDAVTGDLPQEIYWRCLRYSYRICGRQSLLPKSLAIPICYDPMETPQFHGGFADVWKGEYNGKEVAAKALRVSMKSDLDRIRRRFCKEVMTWNTLRHPNVLSLVGVTMTERRFVMVSDWMDNGNITAFLKKNPSANRLDLLGDVTKGLMYMHGQGTVHGDLKGPNILIKNDFRACIADFSLLTIITDQQTFLSTSVEGGTTPWMSPELLDPTSFGFEKCRLTKESDLYALGMVIYEVLSGLVPFSPIRVPILMILRGERPERPRGEQGTWFKDSVWEMLELCWKPRPNERPSLKAVFRCLGGDTGTSTLAGAEADTGADDQSDFATASGSYLSIACRATEPKPSLVQQPSCDAPQNGDQPADPPQTGDPNKRRSFHKLRGSIQKVFRATGRKYHEARASIFP